MTGAAQFGVLIGIVAVTLTRVLPTDVGWAVLFGCASIQLGIAAAVTWRRTRLVLSSAAMAFGSLFGFGIVALTGAGFGWTDLFHNQWMIVVPLLMVGPALLVIESRVHRNEMRRWNDFMRECSLLDVLALRHIPDWRDAGQRGA
jgi:hypothetical protein